jgi:uncharacterized protein (DUF2267 family)
MDGDEGVRRFDRLGEEKNLEESSVAYSLCHAVFNLWTQRLERVQAKFFQPNLHTRLGC